MNTAFQRYLMHTQRLARIGYDLFRKIEEGIYEDGEATDEFKRVLSSLNVDEIVERETSSLETWEKIAAQKIIEYMNGTGTEMAKMSLRQRLGKHLHLNLCKLYSHTIYQ